MRLLALILPLVATLASAQKSEAGRYPMTETMIAGFLRANGFNVALLQVHLPMKVTAATPNPQLEIALTQRANQGEVRFELRCRSVSECLPFDALVDVASVGAIRREVEAERQPDQSADNGRREGEFHVKVGDRTRVHLHVGAQVVLVIEDGYMQIHLPAIAIDSGASGTVVRVCTLDRKKIFRAQVVDDGTVKEVIE